MEHHQGVEDGVAAKALEALVAQDGLTKGLNNPKEEERRRGRWLLGDTLCE